jgi:serine/threonine protein phosphatase PrpC
VCTLLLGNHPVVIIADGLGGEPFGREASQTAVDAAAAALTRVHEAAPDAAAVAPMQLVRVAFAAACSALAERAATMRLRGRRPGLKTTFIVAVASDTRFCFGYIGDGSLLRLRGGSVDNLLVPHKASPDTPNLLTSCLGPEMIGTPVFDEAERMPDDVLMACTDGVADRVADKFYSTTVAGQMAAVRGDFDRAAADVLASLADYRREDEHVFDDNMTLAIVGGGKPPRRAPAIPLDVAT